VQKAASVSSSFAAQPPGSHFEQQQPQLSCLHLLVYGHQLASA
jgi:hypothetical protein